MMPLWKAHGEMNDDWQDYELHAGVDYEDTLTDIPSRSVLPERRLTLAEALKRRIPFEQQDPDEQFVPARCSDDEHHWHENADAEGDTCNCGAWYRFADRIKKAEMD